MIDYLKHKYNLHDIVPLEGGYSFCKKFKTSKYVIKIFPLSEYEFMKKRLSFLDKLLKLELKVPVVFSYGTYKDECYQILSFIDGMSGKELSKLPLNTQYDIGVESGKELKAYHTVSMSDSVDIYKQHKEKIFKIFSEYKKLKISFEHEKLCINYINNNLYLLKGRKTYILHGDFHAENLAFDENGLNGAFDFERYKETDYVRDFERVMVFTREHSLQFVKGFLNGYGFSEFKILKLYLVMGIFNSLVWSRKYYPDQEEYFVKLANRVMDDFDALKSDTPVYL